MLWVYGQFKYYSAGIDPRRQILTPVDVRFRRLKSIPALQGLNTRRLSNADLTLRQTVNHPQSALVDCLVFTVHFDTLYYLDLPALQPLYYGPSEVA